MSKFAFATSVLEMIPKRRHVGIYLPDANLAATPDVQMSQSFSVRDVIVSFAAIEQLEDNTPEAGLATTSS
jgi:hypothetical protein